MRNNNLMNHSGIKDKLKTKRKVWNQPDKIRI